MTHVEALQHTLESGQAALITSPAARHWLSGFFADDGAILLTRDTAVYLLDSRYIEAGEKAVKTLPCALLTRLFENVAAFLGEQVADTLLIEAEQTTVAAESRLKTALTDVATVLADGSLDAAIEQNRRVKTAEELKNLRAAQALTDDGFSYIVERLSLGRTERDVALDLETYLRKNGSEGVSFDFIVASGENGSCPHAVPSDRPLQKGDLVTFDFGAVVGGMHADMTRTVALGAVSDKQKEIYDVVLSAQLAALACVKAGARCADVDKAARDVIAAAGYGDCFGHGTGHGVGFEIHEAPNLSPRAGDKTLEIGNVVTVEPGIYLPGVGGVRIEDMALVTENGHENLTKSKKSLLIL